jgi:hypothetical protein
MALNDGSVRLWAAHPSTPTDFRQAAIVRNSGARASAVCVFAPDARHLATASTQPAARRPRPASGEAGGESQQLTFAGGAPKRAAQPEAPQRTSAAFGEAPARPPAAGAPQSGYGPAFGAPVRAAAGRTDGPRADEEGSSESPPPPPPRTKWTRRVPHPVLTGHAASLAAGTVGTRVGARVERGADEEGSFLVEVFPLDQQLQARARARAPARADLGPVGGVERAFVRNCPCAERFAGCRGSGCSGPPLPERAAPLTRAGGRRRLRSQTR